MTQQETFFTERAGSIQLIVFKTYDERFAHDSFQVLSDGALASLAESLKLAEQFDPSEIPRPEEEGFAELLWGELKESAREEWDRFSYFVVQEVDDGEVRPIFVSPDWPSAEAFAESRLRELSKG